MTRETREWIKMGVMGLWLAMKIAAVLVAIGIVVWIIKNYFFMRYLLLLLLFFVSVDGFGQNGIDSTVDYKGRLVGDSIKMGRYKGAFIAYEEMYIGKSTTTDTIPVILLVCNTDTTGGWYNEHELRTVYWSFGYEVVAAEYSHFYQSKTWAHHSYLDSNKQPIRKSIVVWMTKPR